MTAPVLAADRYRSNAELVAAAASLGYLEADRRTLDATWGRGTFWRAWRPATLIAMDARLTAGRPQLLADFRALPFPPATFGAVVFDPPYKLNGTPDHAADERYGVHVPASWQGRHELVRAGITALVDVLEPRGWLLVKCQDQVCSGAVRWQTREFADHAEALGCSLVDMLHLLGGRPQPAGRRQVHARRNLSTLLVLRGPR